MLSSFLFVCLHMLEQLGFNNSVLLEMISDKIFFWFINYKSSFKYL